MNERYDFIVKIIQEAGELILEKRKKTFSTFTKDGDLKNLVTSVDIEINNFLEKKIHEKYSDEKIYSEETHNDLVGQASYWALDPIDGTSNFSRGIPHFAISIGFMESGKVIVGAIYNPVTRELFSFNSDGVFLSGEKTNASKVTALKDSSALLHVGRKAHLLEWGLSTQRMILEKAKKNGNLGSSGLDLCFLAAGRVDVVIYGTLTTLDIAPAVEMIRAAGGEVYNISGEPVLFDSEPQTIIATATRELFDEIKSEMDKFGR